jgi:hypothetical protein
VPLHPQRSRRLTTWTMARLSLNPYGVTAQNMALLIFFIILSGVRLSLLVLRPLLAYCTSPRCWLWRDWWNEDWQGKPKYSEKTCPGATLSTTNPTWLDPSLKPGRRGGKPATNRLSYGAAWQSSYCASITKIVR